VAQRKPRLRKCAFLSGTNTGGGGNSAAVGLYNNSTGPELVVVHHVAVLCSNAPLAYVNQFQGKFTTLTGPGISTVSSEAAIAGQVYNQTIAAIPTGSMQLIPVVGSTSWSWTHEYPFAVLLPGWSLAFYAGTVNISMVVDFWWEAVKAELYWEYLKDFADLEGENNPG